MNMTKEIKSEMPLADQLIHVSSVFTIKEEPVLTDQEDKATLQTQTSQPENPLSLPEMTVTSLEELESKPERSIFVSDPFISTLFTVKQESMDTNLENTTPLLTLHLKNAELRAVESFADVPVVKQEPTLYPRRQESDHEFKRIKLETSDNPIPHKRETANENEAIDNMDGLFPMTLYVNENSTNWKLEVPMMTYPVETQRLDIDLDPDVKWRGGKLSTVDTTGTDSRSSACNTTNDPDTGPAVHVKPRSVGRLNQIHPSIVGSANHMEPLIVSSAHHTKPRIEDGRQIYKCSYCLYATAERDAFEDHWKVHTGSGQRKTYECTSCGETFVTWKLNRQNNAITRRCTKTGQLTRYTSMEMGTKALKPVKRTACLKTAKCDSPIPHKRETTKGNVSKPCLFPPRSISMISRPTSCRLEKASDKVDTCHFPMTVYLNEKATNRKIQVPRITDPVATKGLDTNFDLDVNWSGGKLSTADETGTDPRSSTCRTNGTDTGRVDMDPRSAGPGKQMEPCIVANHMEPCIVISSHHIEPRIVNSASHMESRIVSSTDHIEPRIVSSTDHIEPPIEDGHQTYTCSYCLYSTVERDAFEDHKKTHTGTGQGKMYECTACGETFVTWKLNRGNNAITRRCTKTGQLTRYTSLEARTKAHQPFKSRACLRNSKCVLPTNKHKSRWTWYRTESGPMVSEDTAPYQCIFCKYRNYDKAAFLEHWETHAEEETPYKCSVCDTGFCTISGLNVHKFEKHIKSRAPNTCNVTAVSESETAYHCAFCKYKSNDKPAFLVHWETHVGDKKPYKCSVCKMSFTTSKSLSDHKQSEFHKRRIRFANNSGQDLTITKSTSDSNSSCVQSKAKTRNTTTAGEQDLFAYHCIFCNYKNYDKAAFLTHWETHMGEDRPYKCSLCEATFVVHNDLKFHKTKKHAKGKTHASVTTCGPDDRNHGIDENSHSTKAVTLTTGADAKGHSMEMSVSNVTPKFMETGTLDTDVIVSSITEAELSASIVAPPNVTETGTRTTGTDVNNESANPVTYKCAFCKYMFYGKRAFLRHWETHIAGRKIYNCSVCLARFATKRSLNDHMTENHSENLVEIKTTGCGYRIDTIGNMDAQNMCYAGVDLIGCSLCAFKTGSVRELNEHMSGHSEKSYRCLQCDYKSAHINGLIGHKCQKTIEIPQ